MLFVDITEPVLVLYCILHTVLLLHSAVYAQIIFRIYVSICVYAISVDKNYISYIFWSRKTMKCVRFCFGFLQLLPEANPLFVFSLYAAF